jgi:leucyl-tRNA---protein transferase
MNHTGKSTARDLSLISPIFGVIKLDFLIKGDKRPCPYLPGQVAQEELFVAKNFPAELYHDFMDHGFRRSGVLFYRPVCDTCCECKPLRVPALTYTSSKSQRRVFRKNQDLSIKIGRPRYNKTKQQIYEKYLSAQHEDYSYDHLYTMRKFLYRSPLNSFEFKYFIMDRLVAVSIVDMCSRSLSSVYTYYDPEFASRSPGTYTAMAEIMFCREQSIAHYYLGYFVKDCPSMNYKARFKPHEILDESNVWRPC